MPLRWLKCPDGERVEVETCLSKGGCRMEQRCATLPYLRLVGIEREYRGVTPSSAGNGPRLIYLKATTDYAASPDDRAFMAAGTAMHGKLALHSFTHDVFAEEELSDEKMKGIADCLEEDENEDGKFVLSDNKNSGSYAVMKLLGVCQRDEASLDVNGNEVAYKSGAKKGQLKTHKVCYEDKSKVDLGGYVYQVNRYRIFFEKYGFPVSRMQLQVVVRDGGIAMATSRGIFRKLYLIPVPRMPDEKVIALYDKLQAEVDEAMKTKTCRRCVADGVLNETWDGRRCEGYCEVAEACQKMGG